jgi:deoxyribodipyrimidine photo-lyase
MSKRALSPSNSLLSSPNKKIRNNKRFLPNKVAEAEASAKVDANPPLAKLVNAMKSGVQSPEKGEAVVHWMRMADLRSTSSFFVMDSNHHFLLNSCG